MAAPEDDSTDIDDLVAELRRRVEERRKLGVYPAGLEAELDAHFERIVAHRPKPYDYSTLRELVAEVQRTSQMAPDRIAYGSSLVGGEVLHRTVAKIVARQTQGVLSQVQAFAAAVSSVLAEILTVLQHPDGHVHADLVGHIDALMERVAAFDRLPQDTVLGLSDVRRRVETLESIEASNRFRPWFGNGDFEEEFRGSSQELRARYADLADRLKGCGPVADLGCGRGEFLELLEERGIENVGVEIDQDLVRAGRDRGLNVEHADAVAWLSRRGPGSLGGLSLVQVIEHLTPQQAVELIALAGDKLRPGGRIVIETINPQSLYIFARAFYVDPTHDNPVHPAYLTFLLREAGFSDVDIDWRSPPPEEEVLETVSASGALEDAFNANVRRLNRLLFGPQDYAIIASR